MSVAATYAQALFEAAEAQAAVGRVRDELGALAAAMAEGSELREAMLSPEVAITAKHAVLADLMADAHPVTTGFARVLVDRGRISQIGEMATAYSRRVDTAEGRVVVTAITAVPLTPELRDQIRDKVRAQTGRDAEIEESVDPSIIGGLVLRVGDVVVDASLRTRLEEMRRSLETAPADLSNAIQA